MFGPGLEAEVGFARDCIADAAVPPFLSADLEGSRMSLPFGTAVPNPLGLAELVQCDLGAYGDQASRRSGNPKYGNSSG